mgnify:CR=1 FL=1
MPVYENIRVSRSRIAKGEQSRKYKASTRKYFYGFTVQMIAKVNGIPGEFALIPGSFHNINGIITVPLNYPTVQEFRPLLIN